MTVSKHVYRSTRNLELPVALAIGLMASFAFDTPAREIVNSMQDQRDQSVQTASQKEFKSSETARQVDNSR